ncbi:MAG: rRNA (cytosine1402-N4)-methyltransferase [Actinomycetota bacterium]|nr:rRNA (cytosine1402-N4)-methyltransferase [Actinomycetota bacterium]
MKGQFDHVPVMGREVVELFLPVPTGLVVDATVGGGGHAALLLEARPDLRLLGVDRDADAVSAARDRLGGFGQRVQVVQGRFGELREIVSERDEGNVIAVLFDLGVSSAQLDRPERGFSYRFDAPLDMRMDSSQSLTAADVVNHYDEARLASVIARFGEERFAGRIAAAIVAARPIDGTRELAEIVKVAIPAATRRRGPHPARRTFQAIRMEVNQELPDLAAGLDDAVHLIGPGGRVEVLAYHSLEDRMVKERFLGLSQRPALPARLPVRDTGPPAPFRLLSRRAIRPTPQEVASNPRAESARLRAVERRENAG